MPRFIVTDSGAVERVLKRLLVTDSGGVERELKRLFVVNSAGTSRLVFQGGHIITVGSFGVFAGTAYGYDDGTIGAGAGSISNTDFNGATIRRIAVKEFDSGITPDELQVFLSGSRAQSFFTSITIESEGLTLDTVDATYADNGSYTEWVWSVGTIQNSFWTVSEVDTVVIS